MKELMIKLLLMMTKRVMILYFIVLWWEDETLPWIWWRTRHWGWVSWWASRRGQCARTPPACHWPRMVSTYHPPASPPWSCTPVGINSKGFNLHWVYILKQSYGCYMTKIEMVVNGLFNASSDIHKSFLVKWQIHKSEQDTKTRIMDQYDLCQKQLGL